MDNLWWGFECKVTNGEIFALTTVDLVKDRSVRLLAWCMKGRLLIPMSLQLRATYAKN